MRFDELRDRRVAIWGFGREGHAVIKALRSRLPTQALTLFCSAAEVDAARAFGAALDIVPPGMAPSGTGPPPPR